MTTEAEPYVEPIYSIQVSKSNMLKMMNAMDEYTRKDLGYAMKLGSSVTVITGDDSKFEFTCKPGKVQIK